jgi:tRNA A-37 threonylcarbamoyl transferase component Bud32
MDTNTTCPLCGKQHRSTARYCPETGKLIPTAVQPPAAAPGPLPPAAVSEPQALTGGLIPQTVINNRYAIITKIGTGGMAAVYQAADIHLPGQIWAVKEMSERWITDPLERAQAVHAFQQEALVLAKLNHPNLPRVIDSFSDRGKQYLVMEYIHGQTLEKMLAQRTTPFAEAEVLKWTIQLCDVLTYLHNQPQPIIFRDLKPSNIMINQAGQIKLIDFGIVRFFKPGQTKDTMAIGTQGYCATEAISGQTDARSDLYSLCVVIHEMLTKHNPATTLFNLPPVRQINPVVSPEWEHIIHRGLERDRDRRWPDVKTFGAELSRSSRVLPATLKEVEPWGTPVAGPQGVIPAGAPPIPRTSRPTQRLVAVAAQLSTKQLAAAIGAIAIAVVAGFWFLAPILIGYPFIWNNIPVVAVVAPFVYAAVPRRWVASIAHAVLALVGGLTIYFRLTGFDNYLLRLFLGTFLSAGFIEIWLGFLDRIRGKRGQEAWGRELAWYCLMAMIATGVLYQVTFGRGLNPWLWLGATLMAALGWFLGDMLKESLKLRHTGIRRGNL